MQTLKKSANRISSFFPSFPLDSDPNRPPLPASSEPQLPVPSGRNYSTNRLSRPLQTTRKRQTTGPSADPVPITSEGPRRNTISASASEPALPDILPPPPPIGNVGLYASSSTDNIASVRSVRPSMERSRPSSPINSRANSPVGRKSMSAIINRPITPVRSRAASPARSAAPNVTSPPSPPESNLSFPKTRRKTWLSNKLIKEKKDDGPISWVIGHPGRPAYDMHPLLGGHKVNELWDDFGDTLIYLFPKESGRGPSFRLDSSVYSTSPVLTKMAHGGLYSQGSVGGSELRRKPLDKPRKSSQGSAKSVDVSPDPRGGGSETSSNSKGSRNFRDSDDMPRREVHLFIPIKLSTDNPLPKAGKKLDPQIADDIDILVGVRNMFAFLLGQSLVATVRRSSIFAIFMRIAEHLQQFEFSNADRSTYGEVAAGSFENYVEELHIADVRVSREKTIEGLILAERMRSAMLYNESFVHAVGKYDDIAKLRSVKYGLISAITRNRLERANMDVLARVNNIKLRLADFDFPAIFAGIMDSKTADERKEVNFDAWKQSFMSTRKFFLGCYRHTYGSWPPKASSKKNDLEISGLNRIVLKNLYHDFSMIYDLMVDRASLTTRTMEGTTEEDDSDANQDPVARALRAVLSEFDRSSPPVQPPAPFDIPQLPTLKDTRNDFGRGNYKKDAKARIKRLKDDEVTGVLRAAHNSDAVVASPFIHAFLEFENRCARGKSIEEVVNLRVGQWIFVYAVLQSLPMLVIDAPNVKWTKGVEYFLCIPPRSRVPWARDDTAIQRSWYGVAGGTGVVSLPTDVIEHGVEGIYRRSHCWLAAEKWAPIAAPSPVDAVRSQSQPNPTFTRPRPQSRSRTRQSQPDPQLQQFHHAAPQPMPAQVPLDAAAAENGLVVVADSGPGPMIPPPTIIATPAADFVVNTNPQQQQQQPLQQPLQQPISPLAPPPTGVMRRERPSSRADSPSRRSKRETIMMSGLEALPLPAGVTPTGTPPLRPINRQDPTKTFDAILSSSDLAPRGRKKNLKREK